MAHGFDEFLEIEVAVAKSRFCLREYATKGLLDFAGLTNDLDPFTATTVYRFQQYGITDFIAYLGRRIGRCQNAMAAWHDGNIVYHCRIDRVGLVAHDIHRLCLGADKVEAIFAAESGESGILRQEPDARVQ